MRFILIDPDCRKAFDIQAPIQLSPFTIAHELRIPYAAPVQLATAIDLWTCPDQDGSTDPSFRFAGSERLFVGLSLICGRTKLDECKGLTRAVHVESVAERLVWREVRETALRRAA